MGERKVGKGEGEWGRVKEEERKRKRHWDYSVKFFVPTMS